MSTPSTMTAALIRDYATSNQAIELAQVPMPENKPDSVLIEVRASSVNPVDNIIRSGAMKQAMPVRFPDILGNDVSGVVVSTGSSVKQFKVGDAVFGRPSPGQSGTFAEYISVKESDLALKPSSISHAEAASLPLVALTSWQALVDRARLEKGQKVLIHAGSGGVGTIAIQLAKYLGAEVATTTSTENMGLCKELGASHIIDYKSQAFDQVLTGYDVVFDTLGGATQVQSLKILRKGGILVAIKGTPDTKKLADEAGVRFDIFFMQASGAQLSRIADLVAAKAIRPVIDQKFPLSKIREAMDFSMTGRARGKIVVEVKT